jgi:hypothetical protein
MTYVEHVIVGTLGSEIERPIIVEPHMAGSHNLEEQSDSECSQGSWSGRILRAPWAPENEGLYS